MKQAVAQARPKQVFKIAAAGLSGVLAALTVLGVGHLVAAVIDPAASPFYAMGASVVDHTPHALKDAAIRHFGSNDKLALFASMAAVMVVFAAILGVLERRRPLGSALLVLLGGVVIGAALQRPTATPWFAIPTLVGVVAGVVVLRVLIGLIGAGDRALGGKSAARWESTAGGALASTGSARDGGPSSIGSAWRDERDEWRDPGADGVPGAGWSSSESSGDPDAQEGKGKRQPGGARPPSTSSGGPDRWRDQGEDSRESDTGRNSSAVGRGSAMWRRSDGSRWGARRHSCEPTAGPEIRIEPEVGGTPGPSSGRQAGRIGAERASDAHGDSSSAGDAGREGEAGLEDEAGSASGQRPGAGPAVARDSGGASASRRRFLAMAAGFGAAAVGAAVAGKWLGARLHDVVADRAGFLVPRVAVPAAGPGVRPSVPGLAEFVTPNDRFYRVDTALQLPALTSADWRLRIHGMVDRPRELDFDELRRRVPVARMITMTCVSNEVGGELAGTAVWTGYPLADLLAEVGVRPEADLLLSRSIDGFTAGTPVSAVTDGRDALLAIGMNGEPLPIAHGYPARLIVPGLYGYVSATKWVIDLELTRFDRAKAYWTERGWGAKAPVKTASRIDVPAAFATVPAGELTIAGVAWAQHRGIDAVEIQIDDQPWQPATLADEYSTDTWRQWTYRWPATPGPHTLRVRATDRTGTTQTDHRTPPFPDGSTGWHSRVITVR
ncbi:molybdopterin-dependent oxidoreductase [Nocardia sp. NPDC051321]|uniref:molybdopterin-dependent oxidoreductase n=1 Tax=Nocardia sp. NPDC051321 TaxID=3364323 RepID=UPI0037B5FFB6